MQIPTGQAKSKSKYRGLSTALRFGRDDGLWVQKQIPCGNDKKVGVALDAYAAIHYHLVVDALGTTFSALADPTRRAMVQRLSRGPASVHGLTEPFALSQQMISKHIAYLVRARIVVKTKRGRESVCTLRPEAIKTVSDWGLSYRQLWEERLDRLDAVVQQMKKEEAVDDKQHE